RSRRSLLRDCAIPQQQSRYRHSYCQSNLCSHLVILTRYASISKFLKLPLCPSHEIGVGHRRFSQETQSVAGAPKWNIHLTIDSARAAKKTRFYSTQNCPVN